MTHEPEIIFDLRNRNNIYKGVLFAELDNTVLDKMLGSAPVSRGWVIGVMAMIWVDENGMWNVKARFVYPSGRKDVTWKIYDEEFRSGVMVNETYILHELYRFPLINKHWLPNPDGTGLGILEVIRDCDMIESFKLVPLE